MGLQPGIEVLHYDFTDKNRMPAAGATYGGYMINWIEWHTDWLKCLISHAVVFDLRSMYEATEKLWWKTVHEWLAVYLKQIK